MKKRTCRKCRIITDQNACPICKGENFAPSFKGRVHVLDASKSVIAKRMNAPVKGEYAIRI